MVLGYNETMEGRSDELTLAQVQFNLYRAHEWLTVGAGSEQEVTAQAASGYYSQLQSPAGDLPCKVRIHRPASKLEMSASMRDLAQAAEWQAHSTDQ
ncbi:MAG: hypothetical protein QOG08_667 [Chloroflexota bacterium]|nr:hypothetical protein [Chloroflexota bacterium]